ncbi:MAG: hypothetical protein K2V38_07400, partial [Gemmataceae bacterium]|nr:hypothetical protein [Gemmataceae bacterium]
TNGAGTPGGTPAGATPAHTDQPDWSGYQTAAFIGLVAGWGLFAAAGLINLSAAEGDEAKHDAVSRFFVAYLSGFTYWLSLPVGALGLLMIRYVAKTSWGLLLTRPLEAATRTLPLTIVLFLPLAAAVASKDLSPYWWSHPDHTPQHEIEPKTDPSDKREKTLNEGKKHANVAIRQAIDAAHAEERREHSNATFGFLSANGYLVVGAVVFLIWGTFIFFLNKWGKQTSDATDPAKVDAGLEKLKNISSIGLVIYAIVNTAAATQWVMSTEPGWSSTMFPVIFTVNTFLTTFAFCLAMFLLIADRPPFKGHMRPKFQLDMGTLMLVFTLFWSYTSFSQFMLIWIGNLPEEIPYYLKRSNEHGHRSFWWFVSAGLIALHFALPFLLLLFRAIKLDPKKMRAVALYLLVICAVDVVWWIAPSAPVHDHFPTWLMDVGAVLGIGGIWLLFFIYQLKQRPIFPDNQAFLLPEGHEHGHH